MNPQKRENDLALMLIGGVDSVLDDWVWAGNLNPLDVDAQRLAVLRVALEIELRRQGMTVERLFSEEE